MPSLPIVMDGSGSESESEEDDVVMEDMDGSGSENESEEDGVDMEGSGSEHAAEEEPPIEPPIEAFKAGNEFLIPEPPLVVTLDALAFRIWNSAFIYLENRYMNRIEFEPYVDAFGDDDNIGYTDEIMRNLSKIAHYLSVRRKLRYFKYDAHRYRVDIPDIIEEFKTCTEVLAEDSVEVTSLLENPIQIRNPPELDVALFLIDGNADALNLPIFYVPTERIFEILHREANGRFRCIIKHIFEWGAEIVLGGSAPAAAQPPPAQPPPVGGAAPAVAQPPPAQPPPVGGAAPAAIAQPPPAQPPPENGHLAAANVMLQPPANGNGYPANGHP